MKKQKQQGKEAFETYYRELFLIVGEHPFGFAQGEHETPLQYSFDDLINSFNHKNLPIFIYNPKYEEQIRFLWGKSGLTWKTVVWFPQALYWPPEIPYGETVPGFSEKLLYPMNISSLLPVLALDPKPDELILDACSAPGGKTLGIVFRIRRDKSRLVPTINTITANDVSSDRRKRLRQNLDDFQITDIEVWGRPAETIYKQYSAHFDKILLDAPCSSEKHVWNDIKYLKEWTPNRIKTLHKRQLALLGGLILALKPGGTLVYSTCAVNALENEGTVGELLAKKGDQIELIDWQKPIEGSKLFWNQDFGFDQKKVLRVLPSNNFDPMFVAVLRKLGD